jgi:hypothetical protein
MIFPSGGPDVQFLVPGDERPWHRILTHTYTHTLSLSLSPTDTRTYTYTHTRSLTQVWKILLASTTARTSERQTRTSSHRETHVLPAIDRRHKYFHQSSTQNTRFGRIKVNCQTSERCLCVCFFCVCVIVCQCARCCCSCIVIRVHERRMQTERCIGSRRYRKTDGRIEEQKDI